MLLASAAGGTNGNPILVILQTASLNFSLPTTERRLLIENIVPTARDALIDVGPPGSPTSPKWEEPTLPTTGTVDMGLRRLFHQRVWPGAGALGSDPAVQLLAQARTALHTEPPMTPAERASAWRALCATQRGCVAVAAPCCATRHASARRVGEGGEARSRRSGSSRDKSTTHNQPDGTGPMRGSERERPLPTATEATDETYGGRPITTEATDGRDGG